MFLRLCSCALSGEDSWDEEKSSEADKKEKKKKEKKHANAEWPKLVVKEALTINCPEIAEVAARLRNMIVTSSAVTPDSFFVELRMLQVSQDFDAKVGNSESPDILFTSN